MGAISTDSYANIAVNYGTAYNAVQDVSDYYYQAAYEIVILVVFDPEIDLLVPFYNAYLTAQSVIAEPPSSVVTAVNRLQSHILDKARYYLSAPAPGETWADVLTKYSDINDWIAIQVGGLSATRVMDPSTTPPTRDPHFDQRVDNFVIAQAGGGLAGTAVWSGFKVLSERAGYQIT
jgi:hypothetical protein